MSRLYYVHVEFEFPVLAESEDEALDSVSDAIQDVYMRDCAQAYPAPTLPDGKISRLPDDYDKDCLVYGVDHDLPLGEAILQEEGRLRVEKMNQQQIALPGMEGKKP